jgi:hypothetical protein
MRDFSVVIPYTVNGAKWEHNELRYALRSIAKNFDFEYDITILSDGDIPWIKNVNVIKVDRFYPKGLAERLFSGTKHYENFYDTLNKIKLASQMNDLSENILWVYDDILLLKTQDKDQIKTLYAGDEYERRRTYWDNPKGNKWKNTIFQAIRHARGFGEVYLYETHLPRYYTKTNLQKMFKMFPIEHCEIPYAPATLYFNMFYKKPGYNYRDKTNNNQIDNPIKAGFYGQGGILCDSFPSKTPEQVNKHTANKIWISYNDAGMSEHLKNWIMKQFPKKCKYEK